jgi:hypothetical protein
VQAIGLHFSAVLCCRRRQTCGSFSEVKKRTRSELVALAKAAITYGKELMLAIFNIVQGTISTIMTLPDLQRLSNCSSSRNVDTIESCGFFECTRVGCHSDRGLLPL